MFAYAVRRLLQFIPTILAISLIIFLLLNVLPGNAALMAAGTQDRGIDAHYIEMMKKDWGLDKPLYVRYFIYLKDLARGDLGLSFLRREPVRDLIAARLWPTLKLAIVAMVIALVGMLIMVLEGLEAGNFLGNLMALVSAVGFAVFAVSLRWRKETPQFTTVALAGALCALLTMLILIFLNDTLVMPPRNVYLSMLHGFIVGGGLILFSMGAKFLPAAELALLSLVEVVGGILWVYLPIFGIHEVPSALTVVGGIIVLSAIVLDGMSVRQKRQTIGIT